MYKDGGNKLRHRIEDILAITLDLGVAITLLLLYADAGVVPVSVSFGLCVALSIVGIIIIARDDL
jgi:hypothetical protein